MRIGAYVLAADPTWLRSSLSRYYPSLDVLVISASISGRGWTGREIPSDRCVEIVRSLDTRGIVREVRGEWTCRDDPMAADTMQRQAAIDAMPDVDWVLQIDTDEILPDFGALQEVLDAAEARGIDAVEWPMRVLFRRLRDGRYLEVTAESGRARYEYPGPIAVRPTVTLADARRTRGPFLRPIVEGDTESTQVVRPPDEGEIRLPGLQPTRAILHNSWAREPTEVRRKITSWGHNQSLRSWLYYWRVWLPAPLRWRRLRDFHPLMPKLWPRLGIYDGDVSAALHPLEVN
jgi:hypothetical protein